MTVAAVVPLASRAVRRADASHQRSEPDLPDVPEPVVSLPDAPRLLEPVVVLPDPPRPPELVLLLPDPPAARHR